MKEKPTRNWTEEELTIALYYYCQIPFGRLHRLNPEIVALATKLGRTPSAIAMKLSNFASFDPHHQARAIKGLKNTSKADREIWEKFNGNWAELAIRGTALVGKTAQESEQAAPVTRGKPTETVAQRRIRLVQGFFRGAVLSSYRYRCGVCSLQLIDMLNASHIIPWAADESRRSDPANGISLCAFHDRAFDRGILTFDDKYRMRLSKRARKHPKTAFLTVGLLEFEGKSLTLPDRFLPDLDCLSYHRHKVFEQW